MNIENSDSALIEFNQEDNENLAETINEYFLNKYDESTLIIVNKLDKSDLNENFFPNEEYFGIQMYNEKNMCLNEMITRVKREFEIKQNFKSQKTSKPTSFNDRFAQPKSIFKQK